MYAALWRILPGPAWMRVVLLVVLVVAVVAALFSWVFPWVQDLLTPDDVVIGDT